MRVSRGVLRKKEEKKMTSARAPWGGRGAGYGLGSCTSTLNVVFFVLKEGCRSDSFDEAVVSERLLRRRLSFTDGSVREKEKKGKKTLAAVSCTFLAACSSLTFFFV